MDITDRGTSTTASSWAWAHGRVGATATAGAAIGSVMVAAEAIAAAAARQPIAAIMHAAAAQPAATRRLLIPVERVPAPVMLQRYAPVLRAQQLPAHRLRTQLLAADLTVVAVEADIKVAAVVDMEAAKSNHL